MILKLSVVFLSWNLLVSWSKACFLSLFVEFHFFLSRKRILLLFLLKSFFYKFQPQNAGYGAYCSGTTFRTPCIFTSRCKSIYLQKRIVYAHIYICVYFCVEHRCIILYMNVKLCICIHVYNVSLDYYDALFLSKALYLRAFF